MTTNICRACLSEQKLKDLCDWNLSVDDPNEVMTYRDCFELCTQLDVMKADSIHFLCKGCVQELLNSYRFIRKAQKSTHKLFFLSEKNDISCDFKPNESELVIIQNLYKGEELTNPSKKTEHTHSEEAVEGSKVDLESLMQLKVVKGSQHQLLTPNKIVPKRACKRKQVNVSEPDSQGSEDLKTDLIIDYPDWDSMVEKVADISAPLSEDVSSSEDELCSVERNVLKREQSNANKNLQNSTGEKMRPKSTKGGKEGMECKLPTSNQKSKMFLCDICSCCCSNIQNLHIHQQRHDSNRKRSFTCKECGRQFFTKKVYKSHMKTHSLSREAQFKCSYCGKAFLHKGSLTLHIQQHIGPKIECKICDKLYVRQIDLDIHMRNHSGDLPYQCSKCEKAFVRRSVLKKHELLHTGIRYKCDICSKEYANPSILSRHRLEHTGLPFKCALCSKGFTEPNRIRRHIRNVHKVEDVEEMNNLTIRVPKKNESSIIY